MKNLILLLIIYVCKLAPATSTGAVNSSYLLAGDTSVMGVFVGRTPCREIAKVLNIAAPADCAKLKWSITFFQDPATRKPTTYEIRRTLSRTEVLTGKWMILKGTKSDADATVYQLIPDKGGESLYFQKADDNILFFLDGERNLLIGNEEFSYTLNRKIP